MSSRKKKRAKGLAPRVMIFLSASLGTAAIGFAALPDPVWPALRRPGWPAALLIAGGVLMLLPLLFLHRRRKGFAAVLGLFGLEVALAAVIMAGVTVNLDWHVALRDAGEIDFSGGGISDIQPLERMTRLEAADLSDNRISRVSVLAQFPKLEYVDLSGNPVSDAAYSALQAALPDALVIADARDTQTTSLNLGRHALPDFAALEQLLARHPALRTVDCRESALTESQLARLRADFPSIQFVSMVSVDGGRVQSDSAEVTLSAPRYEDVAAQLSCFTDLRTVHLTGFALTPSQFLALRGDYPDLALDCEISLLGKRYPGASTSLDLSANAVDDSIAGALTAFEALESVTLPETTPQLAKAVREALPDCDVRYRFMDADIDGQTQSIDLSGQPLPDDETLTALMATAPALDTIRIDAPELAKGEALAGLSEDVLFLYDMELLGTTLSTDAETLDFGGLRVQDGQVAQVAQVLRCLPRLRQVDMFAAQLSTTGMDSLFDAFPDVFFGWTIRVCDRYTVPTTITAFSRLNDLNQRYSARDFYALRYCKRLQALDLRHNSIGDVSFLSYFPDLRVLMLSDNQITDITPIGELTKLEYLELYSNGITDFSPLGSLENLIDLNIGDNASQNHHYVDGVEPLAKLDKLQRLWASQCYLTAAQMNTLRTGLENCAFNFTTPDPAGNGWRSHARYAQLREMFTAYTYQPFK